MPAPPRRAPSRSAAACGQSLSSFLLCALNRVAERAQQLEQPRVELGTDKDRAEGTRRNLLQSCDATAPAPAANLQLVDAITPAQRRMRTGVREVMIQLVRENCTLAVFHSDDA